jgi:hypothetical protein
MKTKERPESGKLYIEGMLKSVRLNPPRPGLRDRILKAARKRKAEIEVMTPFFWKCLGVCAAALVCAFISDAVIWWAQQDRLKAFMNAGADMINVTPAAADQLVASILSDAGIEPDILERLRLSRLSERHVASRRDLLEDVLRKEFGENETAKDPD